MLTSFTVERYKPYADRTTIALKPLTLLYGYNNAGKSALLRALPLLADSILAGGRSPFKRGGASRGGTFDDLLSRVEPTTRPLSVGLAWGSNNEFDAEVRDLPERHRQVVDNLRLVRKGRVVTARWLPGEDESGKPDQWYEIAEGSTKGKARIEMAGLLPYIHIENDTQQWGRLLSSHREDLRRIASGVQWLSSLRSAPGRSFQPGDAPPQQLEPDGHGVQEVLFFDKIDRGGMLREVSSWFEHHFDQTLDLHQTGDSAYLSLSPRSAASLRIPLADTGEGMAQVLPILVATAMARKTAGSEPRVLALEQPELHLHPAAEVALAQHLVETAACETPPVVVVETHSENLLLSVQLQIAEGKIPGDAVAVYWIERFIDGRALVRTIELDREGQAHGWPHGVFSEDLELARCLYQLRRDLRAS